MRLILILFFLLPSVVFADQLKFLTWNVFMIPQPFNFTKQHQRMPLIAKQLLENDYDVILLQEAFMRSFKRNVGGALKERYPFQEDLGRKKGVRKLQNSGLFIVSRIPFTVLDYIYFDKCAFADCLASKGAFLVALNVGLGEQVQVMMTHMQAGQNKTGRRVRLAQLNQIKNLFAKYKKDNVPQLLFGDLNIDGNATHDEFESGLNILGMDSAQLDGELLYTHGFKEKCYSTNAKGDKQWLDHVWMNTHNSGARFLASVVKPFFSKMSGNDCSLSDHYGVESILEF